jgi:hypothetical protein
VVATVQEASEGADLVTSSDLAELRAGLKAEIAELRAELRAEMAAMRAEMRQPDHDRIGSKRTALHPIRESWSHPLESRAGFTHEIEVLLPFHAILLWSCVSRPSSRP